MLTLVDLENALSAIGSGENRGEATPLARWHHLRRVASRERSVDLADQRPEVTAFRAARSHEKRRRDLFRHGHIVEAPLADEANEATLEFGHGAITVRGDGGGRVTGESRPPEWIARDRAVPPRATINLRVVEEEEAGEMPQVRRSALDRLLETLSWDGAGIRTYRQGGAGQENVLTTEVLSALDFLPRSFLGLILRSAHGDEATLDEVAVEAEQAEITVLGEDIFLRPSGSAHGERMTLQPDAVIDMPGTYVLVEAKRIRSPASFGPDQLAKSLAVAVTQAAARRPLVLLVMGTPPPIALRGGGRRRLSIEDSIAEHLPRIVTSSDFDLDADYILNRLAQTIAWITWEEIRDLTEQHLREYDETLPEIRASIARLVESIACVVERHQ